MTRILINAEGSPQIIYRVIVLYLRVGAACVDSGDGSPSLTPINGYKIPWIVTTLFKWRGDPLGDPNQFGLPIRTSVKYSKNTFHYWTDV